MNKLYNPLTDPAIWSLVVANLFTIAWIFIENISFLTILIIYLGQTIIIGLFHFVKMLIHPVLNKNKYKKFDNSRILQKLNQIGQQDHKIFQAISFLTTYLMFHFVYVFFIVHGVLFERISSFVSLNTTRESSFLGNADISLDPGTIIISVLLFFVSSLVSFFSNYNQDKQRGVGLTDPFIRVLPIHLTIIIGGFLGTLFSFLGGISSMVLLAFFLLIKTLTDIKMEIRENKKPLIKI